MPKKIEKLKNTKIRTISDNSSKYTIKSVEDRNNMIIIDFNNKNYNKNFVDFSREKELKRLSRYLRY